MARYVVLTTPTCMKCKVILASLTEYGLLKEVDFVPASSPEGRSLISQHKVMSAGVIIDTVANNLMELGELLQVLKQ